MVAFDADNTLAVARSSVVEPLSSVPFAVSWAVATARYLQWIPLSFATEQGWLASMALELPAMLAVLVLRSQQRRENQAARVANRVLVCDTNAFATGTWHERYMGYRSTQVDEIGKRDRVDLYLLPDIDVPLIQDGWRDGQQIRSWMHQRFVDQLIANTANYAILRGTCDERGKQAIDAVSSALHCKRIE